MRFDRVCMTCPVFYVLIVILIGIWNFHFACGDKMNQIEAQNAAGVGPPASICNEDMVHFSSMEVDNSISDKYKIICEFSELLLVNLQM